MARRVPFSRAVLRYRFTAGSRGADGRWTDSQSAVTVYANIQPASARDREVLPEGDRQKDAIRYSTADDIRTASQHDQHRADELEVDGVRYVVMTAAPWRNVLPHTEGLALRKAEETP